MVFATNLLIETADGVLSGTFSYEQLTVALNKVGGVTPQLRVVYRYHV